MLIAGGSGAPDERSHQALRERVPASSPQTAIRRRTRSPPGTQMKGMSLMRRPCAALWMM